MKAVCIVAVLCGFAMQLGTVSGFEIKENCLDDRVAIGRIILKDTNNDIGDDDEPNDEDKHIIDFFIPAQWKHGPDNQNLIIETTAIRDADIQIVLKHPFQSTFQTSQIKTNILTSNLLKIGWNRITMAVDQDRQINITDQDNNDWTQERITLPQKLGNNLTYQVQGLHAFLNCKQDYRYQCVKSNDGSQQPPFTKLIDVQETQIIHFYANKTKGHHRPRLAIINRNKAYDQNELTEMPENDVYYTYFVSQDNNYSFINTGSSDIYIGRPFLIGEKYLRDFLKRKIAEKCGFPSWMLSCLCASVAGFVIALLFYCKEKKRRRYFQNLSNSHQNPGIKNQISEINMKNVEAYYELENDLYVPFEERKQTKSENQISEINMKNVEAYYELENDLYVPFEERKQTKSDQKIANAEVDIYELENDLYVPLEIRKQMKTEKQISEINMKNVEAYYELENDLYVPFEERKQTKSGNQISEKNMNNVEAYYELENDLYVPFEERKQTKSASEATN